MPEIGNYLVLAAVLIPLVTAVLRARRGMAIAAAVASVACIALCLFTSNALIHVALFRVDAMSGAPMLLYACLVLAVLISAPRSDGREREILALLSGTLAVYAAGHPVVLFAGWVVTAWPVLGWTGHRSRLPRLAVGASIVLLAAGLTLMALAPSAAALAFGFVVLAAVIRKGLFPFHTWVVAAFDEGPLLPVGLFMNAHLGAFVIARVAIPLMPDLSRDALTLISNLALISALYSAFAGLGENNRRRSLALLMISQSSFILAGLESRSAEGIAGALTFWMVVSAATIGMLIVYRALEKRCADAVETEFAGLAASAPRLAVFFAICGLALVGLPGTLGFAAEDLLFQGALTGHPLLGVALPLATALNAINVFRLFSHVFFGRKTTQVPVFPDALRGERLALSALVLFLIAGGVMPRLIISTRSASAEALSSVLSGADQEDAAH